MRYVYSLAQLLDHHLQLKASAETKSDVFSDSNSINLETTDTDYDEPKFETHSYSSDDDENTAKYPRLIDLDFTNITSELTEENLQKMNFLHMLEQVRQSIK